MKKWLVLIVALYAISACRESDSSSDTSGEAQVVELSYWGWVSADWTVIYRAFEEEHPQIKIKESLSSEDWASSSEKFLAAIAAGNAPDASLQNRHQFKQWASQETFYDVTELASRDNIADEYYPVQYNECSFNGRQYGLPDGTDARFFFWNKDHFREAGLDPEIPPKTWSELEEYTRILNQTDDEGNITRYGFLPYYGNTWTWWYGWLNGGEFLDAEQKVVSATDPRIVYALEWMVDFYDTYAGGMQGATGFLNGFQGEVNDPFVSGRLSMIGNGNWMISNFNSFPDLDYGMAPMPTPDTDSATQVTWSCGGAQAISTNTKHAEEAWTFIKWMTGTSRWRLMGTAGLEERKKEWEREKLPGSPVYVPELTTHIPSAEMYAEEFVPALSEKVQGEYAMAVEALNNTRGCGETMGLVGLVYWNEMHQATENALYNKMTALESLQQAETNVQEALDRAWSKVE